MSDSAYHRAYGLAHLNEMLHDLSIVDLSISKILTPLERDSARRFYQPTREGLSPELS